MLMEQAHRVIQALALPGPISALRATISPSAAVVVTQPAPLGALPKVVAASSLIPINNVFAEQQ